MLQNIPVVKPGIIAVSRDCFPIALSEARRAALSALTALAALAALVLAGCQSPPEGKFTPEQIAAMKSYGFNELNGDWSLGMSDTILFDKNDARLRSESETQIQSMASRLAETGLNHARMDGHTDNYGEESYNEALSLKRANAVADA